MVVPDPLLKMLMMLWPAFAPAAFSAAPPESSAMLFRLSRIPSPPSKHIPLKDTGVGWLLFEKMPEKKEFIFGFDPKIFPPDEVFAIFFEPPRNMLEPNMTIGPSPCKTKSLLIGSPYEFGASLFLLGFESRKYVPTPIPMPVAIPIGD